MAEITCIRPDDWHVHLRRGDMLANVIGYSNLFGRVLVMGNTSPVIATGDDVRSYREEILSHGPKFEPIMSVMLVNKTTPSMLREAFESGARVLKLIPGGTSTGSDDGVSLSELHKFDTVLETAQELGMVFSGHWELLADPRTGQPIFEPMREDRAIPYFIRTCEAFPKLKIVAEHISTTMMAQAIIEGPGNIAGSISSHHIGPYCIGDVLDAEGGVKNPMLYCKPVLKMKKDIEAIKSCMFSGSPKFFFGSDSAPHHRGKKTGPSPAAGMFTAPAAISWILSVFLKNRVSLKNFETFVSRSGARFYGLTPNKDTVTFIPEPWTVPESVGDVIPFLAGKQLRWKIKEA